MPAASALGAETRLPSSLLATSWENQAQWGRGQKAQGDGAEETSGGSLGVGKGKGCPYATGSHWFGDTTSKSYCILRSSCSGILSRLGPVFAPIPLQTAIPSARLASKRANGPLLAESPVNSASGLSLLCISLSQPLLWCSRSLRCLSPNLPPRSLRRMTFLRGLG